MALKEVELTGLKELHKALQELPEKIQKNIARGALRAGAVQYQKFARLHVPMRSGELAKSIRVSTRLRRGVPTARVTAGNKKAFYASMVEFGTAQHTILPKNKKALAFLGKVFEQLEHPGAKPKPFMRPALDEGSNDALAAAAAYIREKLEPAVKRNWR